MVSLFKVCTIDISLHFNLIIYLLLGEVDIILLKYDSTGSLLWTRDAGSTGYDYGYGVAVSGDGFIYVTGYVEGSLNGQPYAGPHGNHT